MLLHSGHLRHEGRAIRSGTRYILVAFVDSTTPGIISFHEALAEHRAALRPDSHLTDDWVLRRVVPAALRLPWCDLPLPPGTTIAPAAGRSAFAPRRAAPLIKS
jgi:hypothetical protein